MRLIFGFFVFMCTFTTYGQTADSTRLHAGYLGLNIQGNNWQEIRLGKATIFRNGNRWPSRNQTPGLRNIAMDGVLYLSGKNLGDVIAYGGGIEGTLPFTNKNYSPIFQFRLDYNSTFKGYNFLGTNLSIGVLLNYVSLTLGYAYRSGNEQAIKFNPYFAVNLYLR